MSRTPQGGPPITRGETTFTPTRKHQPGSRRGNATDTPGRDLAKVAEIAREAHEDGMARRQQRQLNKAIQEKATKAGVGIGVAMSEMRVERMTEHADATQRWWVRRHDYDLNETFGSEVTATNKNINEMTARGNQDFDQWLWHEIKVADTSLLAAANTKRDRQGLPMLVRSASWEDSIYNPEPILSDDQRRKMFSEWAEQNDPGVTLRGTSVNHDLSAAVLQAREYGIISAKTAKELMETSSEPSVSQQLEDAVKAVQMASEFSWKPDGGELFRLITGT